MLKYSVHTIARSAFGRRSRRPVAEFARNFGHPCCTPKALSAPDMVLTLSLVLLLVSLLGCGSDRGPSSSPTAEESPATEKHPATEKDAAALRTTSPQQAQRRSSDEPAARPDMDRDQEIEAADQLMMQDDLLAAEAKFKALLVRDPRDAEVIFRLATLVAGRGDLPEAIELLDSIPVDHPDAGLPALGQSADWCFEAKMYREAERRYQRILQRIQDASQAHRQLAYLYNRQGRRHEASEHIAELCKLGDVRQVAVLRSLAQIAAYLVQKGTHAVHDDVVTDPLDQRLQWLALQQFGDRRNFSQHVGSHRNGPVESAVDNIFEANSRVYSRQTARRRGLRRRNGLT